MDNYMMLRSLTDTDIPLLKKWLNRPHVAAWYEHPLDWIDEAEKRHDEFHWLHHFIVELNGIAIGFCQYYDCNDAEEDWYGTIDLNGAYSIDYLIGEVFFLNKGYGKAIINALMQKLKTETDAKRVLAQPDPRNSASCKTLLACGFAYDPENALYLITL